MTWPLIVVLVGVGVLLLAGALYVWAWLREPKRHELVGHCAHCEVSVFRVRGKLVHRHPCAGWVKRWAYDGLDGVRVEGPATAPPPHSPGSNHFQLTDPYNQKGW